MTATTKVEGRTPDVIVRRGAHGDALAFVRAGTETGRAWLLRATTAGDEPPVTPELGWPIEVAHTRDLARAALRAGLTLGDERAPQTARGARRVLQ
jgi:hypothetical protein